jgi:hypothetical protein
MRILCVSALTIMAALGASARADVVLYDNVTPFETAVSGAAVTATGSTPNTFMAGGYTLDPSVTSITGFDAIPVNLSGTAFDHLQITIFVWDTVNVSGTVNAVTPAFSNLLGTYTWTAAGAFSTGFFFPFEGSPTGTSPGLTLATPLALADNQIGLTFNYQGSTDGGLTYVSATSLTSLIAYGAAPTVGTSVFNGYYRNAAGETDGNFTSTLRSLGQTNQTVAVRIFGVPAPGAAVVVCICGVAAVRRRR